MNYVVDTIVISILVSIVIQIPSKITYSIFFTSLVYFLYYFVAELAFGRTIGKLATKTKVVSVKNKRPHVFHIFARTILRSIPIDAFSYLVGQEQGIHDVLSQTKLVKISD